MHSVHFQRTFQFLFELATKFKRKFHAGRPLGSVLKNWVKIQRLTLGTEIKDLNSLFSKLAIFNQIILLNFARH